MSELPVTEDQRRRLEAVCDDLEDAFVGSYGSVTPEDALEYLLDTYTPPGESGPKASGDPEGTEDRVAPGVSADPAAARARARGTISPPVAVGTTDRPGQDGSGSPDGNATDTDTTDDDLTAIPGVGDVTAEALRAAGFETMSAIRAADPEALTAAEGIAEKQAIDISAAAEKVAAGTGVGSDADDAAEDEDDDETAASDQDAAPGSVSAAQTLQQAQNLLDAHDDRWREGSGDEPYEVDLPDGSTEGARTKDDVKRLLFKHWR